MEKEKEQKQELEKKVKEFEGQSAELKRNKSPLPGSFSESTDQPELTKTFQDQLRKINLLFDDNAKDYEKIDFNGLYSLLEKVKAESEALRSSQGQERKKPRKINFQQTEKEKITAMENKLKQLEVENHQLEKDKQLLLERIREKY